MTDTGPLASHGSAWTGKWVVLGPLPDEPRRWREMDSNFWYRGTKAVDSASADWG
jgi:hypothetical protein